MQLFFWAARAIIVFTFAVAAENTCTPVSQFAGRTESRVNDSGVTASSLRGKDSAAIKSCMLIKEGGLVVKHLAPGEYKSGRPAAGSTQASSGPAELTLEYLAVQLCRSYALQ
jgi:hypothetical protein